MKEKRRKSTLKSRKSSWASSASEGGFATHQALREILKGLQFFWFNQLELIDEENEVFIAGVKMSLST